MAGSTDHPVYSCRKCRTAIALRDDLVSKSFWAKSGRAFLFHHAMNVVLGQKEEKNSLLDSLKLQVFTAAPVERKWDGNTSKPIMKEKSTKKGSL